MLTAPCDIGMMELARVLAQATSNQMTRASPVLTLTWFISIMVGAVIPVGTRTA